MFDLSFLITLHPWNAEENGNLILISLVLSTSLNTATYFVNGEKNGSEFHYRLNSQVVDILLSTTNILQNVVASFSGVLLFLNSSVRRALTL